MYDLSKNFVCSLSWKIRDMQCLMCLSLIPSCFKKLQYVKVRQFHYHQPWTETSFASAMFVKKTL